jgi:signal transduction histidine kinase/ActR/RegA family two-component response regulator
VITIEGHKPQTFEVIATPIQISETKSGWTILIREVTEVRRVQELAQEQDRLAAVGQLAAGIAHDFNNIIAAITLFSEMLMDETGLSPKGKERITVIQQQSQRAANLTRQILDFSRKTVMDLRSMDLVPFLKEFDKLMTRILPESIHLKLKYSDKSYMVRADPSRIEQVFMNLALNARDAISGNGELCYEIEHVQFGPDEQPPFAGMTHDRWIRLRVSDTGSGIPPDVLPHIFNPFFTTKSPGQGTGLGLAQVYGIVKQHDGYIEVTSQVEEGTTFTIYFPALEAQSLTKPLQEATQLAHGNRETILVVEDEQATRQAICEILESLNYQPMSASNGQEALALLKKETGTIDMLLSDMVMPEIGGMELFQLIQDMQLDIPLLLMTAYPLGKDTQMLLDRKQVTWIQKPIDLETLSNAIWEKLHKKS